MERRHFIKFITGILAGIFLTPLRRLFPAATRGKNQDLLKEAKYYSRSGHNLPG